MNSPTQISASWNVRRVDLTILLILAIGAGCGIIYEYLLSHYAGRVLGAMEEAIYGIITIMMISMGVGAFWSRKIRDPYSGFALLEVLLALLGSSSVLLIGGLFALSSLFPQIIAETFALPPDLIPKGGLLKISEQFAKISPYLMGALLGLMIGMEIPLIGRIRAELYKDESRNNAGVIYGIDYIGAGVGAMLWIFLMLSIDITLAAALTAMVNLLLGLVFILLFHRKIRHINALLMLYILCGVVLLQLFSHGRDWSATMEDLLYRDQVIFQVNTRQQHLVITERRYHPELPPVLTFYLNGRTQFASNDEHIYHSMLTYPALLASARRERILVIGGGDGLALRDLLRWNPKEVVLIDRDPELVNLFSEPREIEGEIINQPLLDLNQNALSDPRVEIRFGDAFIEVDQLLRNAKIFDTIIVDLPDPSHPDLNKLYSSRFYTKLHGLLAGDGAIAIQSTSPYHAQKTFISIGKTVKHAGFLHVEQYHANVPSFGEWGWTIATKNGLSAQNRLKRLSTLPLDDGWITPDMMKGAFAFSRNFFNIYQSIEVNRLGSMVAYQYHRGDWERELGLLPYTGE